MGAVPRLENGWATRPWGFDSLSFRLRRHGRVERQRIASAQAAQCCPQVRILLPPPFTIYAP